MNWIKVSTRKPDSGTSVIGYCYRCEKILIGYNREHKFHSFLICSNNDTYYEDHAITHWQPLPKRPRK